MLEGLATFGVRVSDKKLFTTLVAPENTLVNFLTQPNFGGKCCGYFSYNIRVSASS